MQEHPFTRVRRTDRAQDDPWIESFLEKARYGVLATVHDGQPFLNTNLFVYDEERNAIYVHTALEGRTRANILSDPRVCFTAAEMGRILPAGTALEFSVEYASVVAFGRAQLVPHAEEARRGLQLLLDKYAPHLRPGRDYRPITSEEMDRTSVFRIDIEAWSGKRKVAGPDFPGAFPMNPPTLSSP
jgi:nitroimidazol reductase NimA-like FMN-containing flavoprotein (pyridoxamine 5'-phosphate oxidase superfamily)